VQPDITPTTTPDKAPRDDYNVYAKVYNTLDISDGTLDNAPDRVLKDVKNATTSCTHQC
jgi:hypothetical protein